MLFCFCNVDVVLAEEVRELFSQILSIKGSSSTTGEVENVL